MNRRILTETKYPTLLALLLESRADFIKTKFGDRLMQASRNDQNLELDELMQALEAIDPTPNKMYLQWLAVQYIRSGFRLEDAGRTRDVLERFHEEKRRLDKKDINQYRHWSEILDALEGEAAQKAEAESNYSDTEDGRNVLTFVNNSKIAIVSPNTYEAAVAWSGAQHTPDGKPTQWCTAMTGGRCEDGKRMFNQYNTQGPLWIIVLKDKDRKFQFHYESSQFMDEKDRPVPQSRTSDIIKMLSEYPEYNDFINANILIHYIQDGEEAEARGKAKAEELRKKYPSAGKFLSKMQY